MNGRTFDEEANLGRERYFSGEYQDRKQFDALVSQILAVGSLMPKSILEIGPGNGFVSNYLRSAGYKVTTFDINNNLKPDVIGNLIEIENYFNKNSFDLILCAEVLEHLPYSYFDSILKSLKNLTKAHLIITLPRRHRILLDLRLYVKIPFVKAASLNTFYRIPDRQKWEGHHWEVDFSKEYSQKKIEKDLQKHFALLDTYVDERVRHHQYYILKKN